MTKAITVPRHSHALLDYILEEPQLVAAVQRLEPAVLTRLIEHVGLEDAGDIAALATTEQLERVFDEDLWKSERPGVDESFDADRFGLWLAVLVEQGAAFAAKKLAEMDQDLVTLGLSRHLFVIDIEQLAQRMSNADRGDEEDQLDKQLESGLYHEFEQYRVISRNHRSWEAIFAVLVELNTHDYGTLERLLERCCDISTEYIEDNGGLYNVLTSDQMMESDVAAEREDRREQAGHVAPSAALSFLKLARVTSLEEIMASKTPDPITRAHFRAAQIRPVKQGPSSARAPGSSPAEPQLPRLLEVLRAADVFPDEKRPKALGAGAPGKTELLLARAMRTVRERDGALYDTRAMELAYLANALLSGCGVQARSLRPVEAAEAALAVCNLGAEHALGAAGKVDEQRADELAERLRDTDLVKLFRIGFHLLCGKKPHPGIAASPRLKLLRVLLERQGLAG